MRLENSSPFVTTDSSAALYVPFYTNQRAHAAARHLSPVMQTKMQPHRLIRMASTNLRILLLHQSLIISKFVNSEFGLGREGAPVDSRRGRVMQPRHLPTPGSATDCMK